MNVMTVAGFVALILALTFLPTIIALCTRKVLWREAFMVNLVLVDAAITGYAVFYHHPMPGISRTDCICVV